MRLPVTLDLGGFRLDGSNAINAIGVSSGKWKQGSYGYRNITLRNGTVRGFYGGKPHA